MVRHRARDHRARNLLRSRLRREFGILGSVAANDVPTRSGIHKDVHLYLNAGIAIDAPERYAMNLPTVCSTESCSANAAET